VSSAAAPPSPPRPVPCHGTRAGQSACEFAGPSSTTADAVGRGGAGGGLRSFLDCGILARGSLRLSCPGCNASRVVPFSCQRRSFCPSCMGRRMADTAARLVDQVFPRVPIPLGGRHCASGVRAAGVHRPSDGAGAIAAP
jgi:hypothetical protein